jgi:hypothetical protein
MRAAREIRLGVGDLPRRDRGYLRGAPATAAAPAIAEGERCSPAPASTLARPLESDKPITLKASVHVSRAHGCSQSMETTASISEYALELRGESVRLTIETFDSTGFGPAKGTQGGERREFHHASVRWRRVYTGTARGQDGGVTLAFTGLQTSVDRTGGINFSNSTKSAVNPTVDCVTGGVGILPPLSSGTEREPRPLCAEALLCLGLSTLAPLPASAVQALGSIAPHALVEGRLPLLPEPGIHIRAQDFYRNESASFRQAK